METITLTEPTFLVLHGGEDGEVVYLEGDAGDVITTGRPTTETFTDEAAAKARAEELGYVFIDPTVPPEFPEAPLA
jgi:hypothetical protein